MQPLDQSEIDELRFIDRLNRSRLQQLINHPDPRDPDHPHDTEEDDEQ